MVYRDKKERGITRLTGGALQAWPINSVYISFVNTNPASLFGGTWSAIGSGRMLVGVDATDAAMDAAGDTGGAKTVTLVEANLPPHEHGSGTLVTADTGGHDHGINRRATTGSGGGVAFGGGVLATDDTTKNAGSHSHNVSGNTGNGLGSSTPVNNLPPYLAVYMWRRTA